MRYLSAPSHHVGRGFIWRARKYETSQLHRFKHAPDRSVNTSSCRRIAAGQRTAASAAAYRNPLDDITPTQGRTAGVSIFNPLARQAR